MSKKSGTLQKYLFPMLFFVIFLLGLALRSPEIISGNYLFGFDQGQNYMRAYDIAVNHKFTLIGAEVGSGSAGVPGLFHGPGYYYLLAIMLVLFHGDPYGGLVLMWVSGVITLVLSYYLVSKIAGKLAGLNAMFLVATAPLIAPQSRFLWGPHFGSVFIVLYLYMLYRMQDSPVKYTFLTVFFAGILYHFELAISVPLVFLAGVAMLIYRIWNRKTVVAAICAAVIAFSPMLLFEVRHGFMAVSGVIKNVTRTQSTVGDKPVSSGTADQFRIGQKLMQFESNFRDSFVFEFGLFPVHSYRIVYGIMLLFIIFSFVFLADTRIKRYGVLLLLAPVISFLVFLPLRGSIWPYYLIHLHFVYIMLVSLGSAFIIRAAGEKKTLWYVFMVFLVVFYGSILKGTGKRIAINWTVDFHDYGGKDKILGKRAAIDYVYKDAAGKPFSVFVFMPPVYTWPYDYLFLTYAKEKYGYIPGQDKKGIGYLIIEQDWQKPWSWKGWEETVIKTGNPIWQRYLKQSDQIIQKRDFDTPASVSVH